MNIVTKQATLRPSDVVVACELALSPASQFATLADATGLSAGECHNAVRRLRLARLILSDERRPANEVLLRFLLEGAPFAFPPMIGPDSIGIPTAHSAPAFREHVSSTGGIVWPTADGTARGQSLTPLYPGAVELVSRNRPLYDLLTIIDAARVGTSRIRKIAGDLLAERLKPGAS
jgi:hypothetical protein